MARGFTSEVIQLLVFHTVNRLEQTCGSREQRTQGPSTCTLLAES